MPAKHGRTQARVSTQQPQQQASTCSAADTPCSMQLCSVPMGDAMVTLVASPRKQAGGLKNADCEGSGLSLAPHALQQRLLSADGTPLQPRPASPELRGHPMGDSSEAVSPCSSQLAYADAASTVKFTPVPLVDRMQSARSPMWLPRLPSLPGGTPLPASCPTTPPGQCRQPAHEVITAPSVGRPLSANPGSIRYVSVQATLSTTLKELFRSRCWRKHQYFSVIILVLQAGTIHGRMHALDARAEGAGGLPAAVQHSRGQGHAHSCRQHVEEARPYSSRAPWAQICPESPLNSVHRA